MVHIFLNVHLVPPTFINSLDSITESIVTAEGGNIVITCEALGYPPPTIVWSRSNGALSDRMIVNDSVIIPTGNGNVSRVGVNLTLTNADREDTGLYQCTASNSVGSDTGNVSIIVQCKCKVLNASSELQVLCMLTAWMNLDLLGAFFNILKESN